MPMIHLYILIQSYIQQYLLSNLSPAQENSFHNKKPNPGYITIYTTYQVGASHIFLNSVIGVLPQSSKWDILLISQSILLIHLWSNVTWLIDMQLKKGRYFTYYLRILFMLLTCGLSDLNIAIISIQS